MWASLPPPSFICRLDLSNARPRGTQKNKQIHTLPFDATYLPPTPAVATVGISPGANGRQRGSHHIASVSLVCPFTSDTHAPSPLRSWQGEGTTRLDKSGGLVNTDESDSCVKSLQREKVGARPTYVCLRTLVLLASYGGEHETDSQYCMVLAY